MDRKTYDKQTAEILLTAQYNAGRAALAAIFWPSDKRDEWMDRLNDIYKEAITEVMESEVVGK